MVGQRGEITLWKRPGKRERGISATTNYAGSGLLYVFSTNAAPFEAERAYSKFAAYTLLNHGGEFVAAARALAAQGYGVSERRSPYGSSPGLAAVAVRSNGVRVREVANPARRLRTMAAQEVATWRR